jgi:hypothetical protein
MADVFRVEAIEVKEIFTPTWQVALMETCAETDQDVSTLQEKFLLFVSEP